MTALDKLLKELGKLRKHHPLMNLIVKLHAPSQSAYLPEMTENDHWCMVNQIPPFKPDCV